MGIAFRLFDLLKNRDTSSGKELLLANRVENGWKEYRKSEILDFVDHISKGLLAIGLKKDDRIAIMSGNRPEWNFVDFACNQLGIATVPLYPTLSAQDLTHILNDSEVKLAFVSNQELSDKIEAALQENNQHLEVYTFDKVDNRKNFIELYALGENQTFDLKVYNDAVHED